jgi:hypothetical protein
VKPYAANPGQLDRFREERTRFRLSYRCPDCVHVVPGTRACSLEYPNRNLLESEHFLQEDGNFVFCKYFEVS